MASVETGGTPSMISESTTFSGTRIARNALVVAVLGAIGTGLGFGFDRHSTYFAYLTAYTFVTSIALGALIFLMTTYIVHAKWNIVLRRLNEAIISILPLLALLFLPIIIGLRDLYLWMQSSPHLSERQLEVLHHRQHYLNEPFFIVRTIIYFVIWIVPVLLFWIWSLRKDARARSAGPLHTRERGAQEQAEAGAPVHGLVQPSPEGIESAVVSEWNAPERILSGALIVPVSLALTFAAFDWLMSLQPLWSSTMFGVYFFAGGFVACFGLLSVLGFFAQRSSGLGRLIRPPHFHALGRLMLGFTIFWGYCAFFQAMLIQIANKPEEIRFYVLRVQEGFRPVTLALAVSHFLLPFFVLLPRSLKYRPRAMAIVGVWILAAHYLDMLWLVLPIQHGGNLLCILWYASALAAIGGVCVAFAALLLRGKPLVPIGDPLLAQSIAYRSPT